LKEYFLWSDPQISQMAADAEGEPMFAMAAAQFRTPDL